MAEDPSPWLGLGSLGSDLVTVERLRPFSVNVFAKMSALAAQLGAVNLGQGFPDEDGPPPMLEAARQAIADGINQYPRASVSPNSAQQWPPSGHAAGPGIRSRNPVTRHRRRLRSHRRRGARSGGTRFRGDPARTLFRHLRPR